MRGEQTGSEEKVAEMVLLLLSYFDEKEDVMFSYVDDTCLVGEVQMDQVPLTPTTVICGTVSILVILSHTCINSHAKLCNTPTCIILSPICCLYLFLQCCLM